MPSLENITQKKAAAREHKDKRPPYLSLTRRKGQQWQRLQVATKHFIQAAPELGRIKQNLLDSSLQR